MQTAFPQKEQIEAPCLLDFYKCFHKAAYKKGVSEVTINFTGRSGNHSNIGDNTHYMWAGLQGFINTIVVGEWGKFFDTPKEKAVATYKRVNEGGLGRECDTSHIEALHDLGYLPLEFRALPEGVAVPYGVAAMTVQSTHPDFFWLPNFIETILSDEIWPVQTSLTTATAYMRNIVAYGMEDGTPDYLFPFLGHDFSMRGMMGGTVQGGAALSGLGHLMSGLVGSDTLPAALKAEKDYDAYLGLDKPFETIASVDATEHSVQCSFNGNDLEYFQHCMREASPTGILSLVSDGYDFWKLVTEILPQLKDEILQRDGKIVIRPDSGDPVRVICGYKIGELTEQVSVVDLVNDGCEVIKDCDGYYIYNASYDLEKDISEYEAKGLIEVLWEQFGGKVTEQGYKLLDDHIGAIYGDSITLARQEEIYKRLHAKGFAIGNIVLGIGSYTYQYVTRDTHGSAVKATQMIIDGVDTAIQKEVAGDAVKKSAKGFLHVTENGRTYDMEDNVTRQKFEGEDNLLEPVWCNGVWMRVCTLQDVRDQVRKHMTRLYR